MNQKFYSDTVKVAFNDAITVFLLKLPTLVDDDKGEQKAKVYP